MATKMEGDDLDPLLNYTSLWKQIQSLLRPGELDSMKRAIGGIVEDNECLLTELHSLVAILREFRAEQKPDSSKAPTPWSLLPHLPVHELQSKLSWLLQKVTLVPSTPREKQVIEFVCKSQALRADASFDGDSPSTQSCSFSTTPLSVSSSSPAAQGRPVSAPATGRLLSKCSEKLNVFDVDVILDELRRAFCEEHESLLKNVEIVRERLEQAVTDSRQPAPTVQELSALQHRLEEEDAKLTHQQRIASLPDPVRSRPPSEPVSAPPSLRSNLSSRSSLSSTQSQRALKSGTPPSTIHLHPITLQLNPPGAKPISFSAAKSINSDKGKGKSGGIAASAGVKPCAGTT